MQGFGGDTDAAAAAPTPPPASASLAGGGAAALAGAPGARWGSLSGNSSSTSLSLGSLPMATGW